ncbi:hypothetical protein DFQ28_010142 [Apophysomyces sp. BC1034]|nr:hypothetical protein DFQ29_008637 [Apophysomyces sp. BC1021]KAG0184988.1 hypothetical protein DFQ28_010142 [Apophysomyces sp. BC1034]
MTFLFDEKQHLRENTYTWSQNADQVIFTFLIPEHADSQDLDIIVENRHVKAGLRNENPVIKGTLFAAIDPSGTVWEVHKDTDDSSSRSITSSYILPSVPDSSMNWYASVLGESFMMEPPSQDMMIESPVRTSRYSRVTIHLEKQQKGVGWDVPISNGWLSESFDMDISSAYHLGRWHELANDPQVGKALTDSPATKAFEWYKQAADTVDANALACYIVGTTYDSGSTVVDKDCEMALYYYHRCMVITAARIGIDFGNLGYHDQRTPDNDDDSNMADQRYFCSSAFQTGLIYLYGSHPEGDLERSRTRVGVDPQKAMQYWKKASDLGHAQSTYNIGIMYATGMGVEKDRWEAGRWFGRALQLDRTGKLVVPKHIPVVAWDAVKGKKRSRRWSEYDETTSGTLVAIGSVAAVVGAALWWFRAH